jgi:hypothetical protein
MTSAPRTAVAVVGAIVVALGAWLLWRSGSSGSSQPSAVSARDAEAVELGSLLERGRATTFHARYRPGGDASVTGSELAIEVWQRQGSARQDTVLRTGESASRTRTLVSTSGTVLCTQIDDDPWTCGSSSDPSVGGGLFRNPVSELQGADVVATDETVGGRPARCFSFSRDTGTVSYCLTPEGVPLTQTIGSEQVVIDVLDSAVDDSVFVLPTPLATSTGS